MSCLGFQGHGSKFKVILYKVILKKFGNVIFPKGVEVSPPHMTWYLPMTTRLTGQVSKVIGVIGHRSSWKSLVLKYLLKEYRDHH